MQLFSLITKRFTRIVIYSVVSSSLVHCSLNEILDLDQFLTVARDVINQKDTASLDFFVLSDWGFNGSDDQKMVASEMSSISKLVDLQLILTCGDNFQKTGVKSTDDLQWSTNYEDVYTDSSLLVPWYPALGNHDYYENPEVQVEYSAKNDLWNMPSRYYTFVEEINATSSVRFIVLDTQGIIEEYRELTNAAYYNTIAQYSWFKKLLSEASEEWIIVTGHHPVFSANLYHGDSKEMNVMIKPLLDGYNVDFYLCGHDHNFEHAREEGKETEREESDINTTRSNKKGLCSV